MCRPPPGSMRRSSDKTPALAFRQKPPRPPLRPKLGQLGAQSAGLKGEITQLQSQIALQQGLVTAAQKDVDRARARSGQGFLSPRELQNREETFLVRQQSLSQLQQTLEVRRSALAAAGRSEFLVAAQARAQVAGLWRRARKSHS